MMMPSILTNELFNDWMDFPWENEFFTSKNPLYGKHEKSIMKTDIREVGDTYELDIDLPGYKKDQINAQLKDGYLTISASKKLDKDEKDHDGNYIRRERYSGSMSRSFYVGDGIQQEDIKAKFEDGILKLSIPKSEPQKVETNNYIAIEG